MGIPKPYTPISEGERENLICKIYHSEQRQLAYDLIYDEIGDLDSPIDWQEEVYFKGKLAELGKLFGEYGYVEAEYFYDTIKVIAAHDAENQDTLEDIAKNVFDAIKSN